jgi:hypothetical protein
VRDDTNVDDSDVNAGVVEGVEEARKLMPHQRFGGTGVLRAVEKF